MKILLVEDSSADAYLLKGVMAKTANSPDIDWVPDGTHGLDYVFQRNQYAHAERPDMILLDLNMPRVSGYEMLTRLKAHPSLSTIPVIILTTSRDPSEHTQCKTMGADMCLSKPSALRDYEDMVQRIMRWAFLRLHDTSDTSSRIN